MGKWRSGEEHPEAKLTAEDARLIRALRCEGLTLRCVAEKFEVSIRTIRDVVEWRTWIEAGHYDGYEVEDIFEGD